MKSSDVFKKLAMRFLKIASIFFICAHSASSDTLEDIDQYISNNIGSDVGIYYAGNDGDSALVVEKDHCLKRDHSIVCKASMVINKDGVFSKYHLSDALPIYEISLSTLSKSGRDFYEITFSDIRSGARYYTFWSLQNNFDLFACSGQFCTIFASSHFDCDGVVCAVISSVSDGIADIEARFRFGKPRSLEVAMLSKTTELENLESALPGSDLTTVRFTPDPQKNCSSGRCYSYILSYRNAETYFWGATNLQDACEAQMECSKEGSCTFRCGDRALGVNYNFWNGE